MIDVHCHIAWALDDGAASLEESLAMLDATRESGTTDIVATPHFNAQYAYEVGLLDQRLQQLAARAGGKPRIHRGCEFRLSFDNLDHLLERPSIYTINCKQYLLVECPDLHIGKHLDLIFERIIDAGLVPLIAHPERNPVLQGKLERIEAWVELGCLVQVTASSITGGFGPTARVTSARLLERGLVHVVASDAHDAVHRPPRLDEAYRALRSRYGEDSAEILLTDNPRAIIEGRPLAGGRQVSWKSPVRWWQFWKTGLE